MGYLQFDKSELINLEYSLSKEFIRSNRAGAYSSTTIIGCNTRKYHGLLVCPTNKVKGEKFVLLSGLDVTIIQHGQEFNLGIHKYKGDLYIPRGHKYVRNFEARAVGVTTYRVGGVILEKEFALVEKKPQIIMKYTLTDAHSPTILRFRPFLAFRNMHSLSKANMLANRKFLKVKNGIMSKLYQDLPELYLQFNKKIEFIPGPDWYYGIEYIEEQKRGYEFTEDLFVPGYFECHIKKGESVLFSAATFEVENPQDLVNIYNEVVSHRLPRDSFHLCLINAAEQFIDWNENGTEIIAGFPWFGSGGRETFISLPGITLTTGKLTIAREIIDTMVKGMKGGLFPCLDNSENPDFCSSDTALWFFWALQQYARYEKETDIWKKYKKAIISILKTYRDGTSIHIRMQEDGLIWAGENGKAFTWMNAMTSAGPVTPRKGMAVEVNALWYNAVLVSLEWAGKANDRNFLRDWDALPEMIREAFISRFWSPERSYLADIVDGDYRDFSVRPNQIIAASMDYSPLTREMKKAVLDKIDSELLTPKGLRTLSPTDPEYKGIYEGNQEARESAAHQGSVWPWLLEHYVKVYLEIHKQSGLNTVKTLFHGFEEDMVMDGIGTISELYDGDPPHVARGAISQAWSVAALLRIEEMIHQFESNYLNKQ
jgi:predicted glycogen debranching enzyme